MSQEPFEEAKSQNTGLTASMTKFRSFSGFLTRPRLFAYSLIDYHAFRYAVLARINLAQDNAHMASSYGITYLEQSYLGQPRRQQPFRNGFPCAPSPLMTCVCKDHSYEPRPSLTLFDLPRILVSYLTSTMCHSGLGVPSPCFDCKLRPFWNGVLGPCSFPAAIIPSSESSSLLIVVR